MKHLLTPALLVLLAITAPTHTGLLAQRFLPANTERAADLGEEALKMAMAGFHCYQTPFCTTQISNPDAFLQ